MGSTSDSGQAHDAAGYDKQFPDGLYNGRPYQFDYTTQNFKIIHWGFFIQYKQIFKWGFSVQMSINIYVILSENK